SRLQHADGGFGSSVPGKKGAEIRRGLAVLRFKFEGTAETQFGGSGVTASKLDGGPVVPAVRGLLLGETFFEQAQSLGNAVVLPLVEGECVLCVCRCCDHPLTPVRTSPESLDSTSDGPDST